MRLKNLIVYKMWNTRNKDEKKLSPSRVRLFVLGQTMRFHRPLSGWRAVRLCNVPFIILIKVGGDVEKASKKKVKKVRINKYNTHVEPKLFLIECWARDGYIDEDIAKKLGISIQTFYVYKKQYSEFSESLKRGKEVIDYQVENALLKRALGYKYIESSEQDAIFGTKKKEVEKEVAPDVTAQIFWLKNRRPDKWRDVNHSKNENMNLNADMTEEEAERIIAEHEAKK
jgi:hypothetical protein